MQGDKEKGLQAVDGRQAGAWQRARTSNNIQHFTNASQLARRETTYLRWGTQRFGLAPLESLRRWPHE